MTLTDRIMAMSPEAQAAALMVLDEVSRPLEPREIERAIRRCGVDKNRAVIIASAVKRLHIIAVVGGEP